MPKSDSAMNLTTAYLTQLLGIAVTSVEPLDGGSNSRAFKVTAIDGSKYAAKLYPGPTADGESRLEAEFTALEFLRRRGLDRVPRPVVADPSHQCAIFEFVEGSRLVSSEVNTADIDQACRFLLRLSELKDDPESILLPNAAEACFSIQAVVGNLETRLRALQDVNDSSRPAAELKEFMDTEFLPAFGNTVAWCRKRVAAAGQSMDTELSPENRTLSPSDFGFHNCLRRRNGQLVFLDFEYFGWDDPAKMICDFLLHPAMELSVSLKMRFVENMLGTPKPDQTLLEQVETVFPLFGLKWCLIILNPFLPRYRLQRGLGGVSGPSRNRIFGRQLEKARLMLSITGKENERFPYRDARYAPSVT
jgi:hypothetical protein